MHISHLDYSCSSRTSVETPDVEKFGGIVLFSMFIFCKLQFIIWETIIFFIADEGRI